jgi:galactose mutarotase-like enzyme
MIELFSQNKRNRAQISLHGAEVVELTRLNTQNEAISLLWKVNEQFWNRVSPILFPLVGKVKDNQYEVDGTMYSLPQHGFARNQQFECVESSENSCKLKLKNSNESFSVFPFEFELIVEYILENEQFFVRNTVVNTSISKPLYYSIGAHPGFQLQTNLSDYHMELENVQGAPLNGDFSFNRYLIKNELYTGETENLTFVNGKLKLNNDLFSSDAIVFKNEDIGGVSIFRGTELLVNLKCPQAPYWGIWTKPGAPFLCLEPWDGIADHQDHDYNFLKKEGIIELNSLESRSFDYQINW